MTSVDVGVRKHVELDQVKYWLLITAKAVQPEKDEKDIQVQSTKKSFFGLYIKMTHAFYWKIFIVCTVFFDVSIYITYFWIKSGSLNLTIIILTHLTSFFYFVDFMGALLKKINSRKKGNSVKSRKMVFLVMDAISLVPLSAVYLVTNNHLDDALLWQLRTNTLLRFYRIPQFFSGLSNAERHHWQISVFAYASYLILFVLLFANYFLYRVNDFTEINLKDWNKTAENKIVVSFYYAVQTTLGVSYGDILPKTYTSMLMNSVAMIIGAAMTTGLFTGILATAFTNTGKRREYFRSEFEGAINTLKQRKIDKKVLDKVKDNMLTLWKYKKGFTSTPPVHILPLSLQKEIYFDINFGLLSRSLIFSRQPRSFLRSVSLFMKNMSYLPGDTILESYGTLDAMICVASGVIEVLSEENDESVLFSLTTGTILGEATLFISKPITCIIQASTYVELQVLKKEHFSRLALTYPEIFRHMRLDIYDRIKLAEQIIQLNKKFAAFDTDFQTLLRRKETKKLIRNLRGYKQDHTQEPDIYSEEILKLYVLSENIPRVKTLPINLIRAKPWILRPDTTLTKFWALFMAEVIVIVLIAYPIWSAFKRNITPTMYVVLVLTNLIFAADLYLECTTALERKDHFTYITSIKEIIFHKLKTVGFYLDILATYYLGIYDKMTWPRQPDYAHLLLSLNKLLKVWRFIAYIRNLERDIKNNPLFILTIKYIIFFTIMVVWGAALLYLEACPGETCLTERWFGQMEVEAVKNKQRFPCTDSPVAVSLYFAAVTLFTVGYGDIVPATALDCLIVTFCMIVGVFAIVLCMAEASSIFKHLATIRTTYQEEIFAVNRFMKEHEIPKELQNKVKRFLQLQWNYDKGYSIKQNEANASPGMQKQIIMMELTKAFFSVPLFRNTDPDFVKFLAKICKVRVLPPHEEVVEAGSYIREMYILENGYCQVSNERNENPYKKIIGPVSPFGFIEMISGSLQLLSARTMTHARIISLDYSSYLKAITKYPSAKIQIDNMVQTTYKGPTNFDNFGLNTLEDTEKEIYSQLADTEKKGFSKSFINVYKYHKAIKSNYWEPFRAWGKFRFFQILISPYVVLPDSLFIKIWMSIRITNGLILAIFAPVLFCFMNHATKLMIFVTIQQAFAATDVYLMFHLAYFDDRGLLMFHPAKTATRYLKGSFVLDLITVFPYSLVRWLAFRNRNVPPNILYDGPGLLMILHLYKFFQGCHYLETDILRKTDKIKILKFIPLSLVLTNFISGLIILLKCYNMKGKELPNIKEGARLETEYAEATIRFCLPDSQLNQTLDDKAAFKMYLTTLYWVTSTMTSCGFGDITPYNQNTMIAIIIIIVFGLFFYTYMFASIASNMVNTNVLITKHRRKILQMSKFIKKKSVHPDVQKRIILHYEYNWQRTEGATPQKIFPRVYANLREKLVASMYEATVRQVSAFEGLEKIIIRIIGKNLDEIYFLRGETIVKYNDIQEYIYLIYRGEVNLYKKEGALITTMGRGGLFGNISNKAFSLSSEIVIAAENVDVLRLDCKVFFQSLQVFPNATKLIDYLTSRNTDYIEPKKELHNTDGDVQSSIIKLNLFRMHAIQHETSKSSSRFSDSDCYYFKNTIYKSPNKSCLAFVILPESVLHNGIGMCVFVMAYVSVCLTAYMFAFQDTSTSFLVLSYISDLFFGIYIYLQFHISYFNKFGDCVISKKKIRERYINSKKLAYDLVPNLPLDIFAAIPFSDGWKTRLLTILRLNRVFRLFYVFEFYKLQRANLMINKIYLEIGWIIIMASLIMHISGCIWFLAVCPLGYWQEPTWVTEMDLKRREKWELYFYSIYHITVVNTSAGLRQLLVYSEAELVLDIIFMSGCRLTLVLLAGILGAAINTQSLSLFWFQEKIAELKATFSRQNISEYQMVKMWNYVTTLWLGEAGIQMPTFLLIAPYAMKCEVMNAMFGSHLSQCYIFTETDPSFLRQLAVYLKRFVYFPGNYIVQQGDIDETMYFIHKGEVSVLTIHPDLMETIHFRLTDKDAFGMKQGLKRGTPHYFSYRAETDVEIISLTLSHWQVLLKYFPQVEKEITKKIGSLPKIS